MVAHEPTGSVAEEVTKLVAALQGWAREHGSAVAGDSADVDVDVDADVHAADADDAERAAAGGSAQRVAEHESGEHRSVECRYCPLCNLARLAKATSPEVRDHLASAALSMALAVKGLLDGVEQHRGDGRDEPVEKIDLLED